MRVGFRFSRYAKQKDNPAIGPMGKCSEFCVWVSIPMSGLKN